MCHPFTALMLFVGRQKRRLACKNLLNRCLFEGYSLAWNNSGEVETIIGSNHSSLNHGGSGGGSITSSNL